MSEEYDNMILPKILPAPKTCSPFVIFSLNLICFSTT